MVQDELDHARTEYPFVSFDLTVRLGDWGYCDGVIQSVMRNLIENAARHNTSSNPEVTVRLSSEDDRNMETIVVEDNGPGLSEDPAYPRRRRRRRTRAQRRTRPVVGQLGRPAGGWRNRLRSRKNGSVATLRVPKRDADAD
jgi:signal transduction histidine kinase